MNYQFTYSTARRWRWSLAGLALAIQACGGGGGGEPSANDSGSSSGNPDVVAPAAPAAAPAAAPPASTPVVTQSAPWPAPAPAEAPAPTTGAAAPTPTPAPAPAPAPAVSGFSSLMQYSAAHSCSIPGMREAILQQVNLARTAGRVCGTAIMRPVAAVSWNDILFSAAARHSRDMADQNYFSHTSLDGRSFAQRLSNEGYSASAAGENIAAGMPSVSGVMSTWLNSEGHCRNIMEPAYTEVAVACVSPAGTTYGSYWTMELGRR